MLVIQCSLLGQTLPSMCSSLDPFPSLSLQPPSLSPSLRWRSARQMGLPVPTHLPHPLGDVPEDDIIDGDTRPLAASFPSAANQMLPPIPPPTGFSPLQEFRQSSGSRYRKAPGPPSIPFPSNPYGDLVPSAPPTGQAPPPPTGQAPPPPTGRTLTLPPGKAPPTQTTRPNPPPHPLSNVATPPPATTEAPPSSAGPAPPPPPPAPAVPPPPPPPGELKSIHTQIAENKVLTASGITTSEWGVVQ